jgi:hypothetical protein
MNLWSRRGNPRYGLKAVENIFNEILAEISPNLGKEKDTQVQEAWLAEWLKW